MTDTTATIPQQAARLAEQATLSAAGVRVAITRQCMNPGARNVARCDIADSQLNDAIAALVTLITAESLRLDWLLARHTERGSKLIGLGFYPDKQEQRRMIQMAIDAGTCVVDEVDAIEVRKVRLDEARDAALWRAHVAGAGSPQAPAPSAATATALEQERAKFQQETRRTSELSRLLKRWIDRHEAEHGPGPWAKSCEVCALVGESNALLARPINDPAPNAAPHQGADALREDAERYQYLRCRVYGVRSRAGVEEFGMPAVTPCVASIMKGSVAQHFDAAIDAARAALAQHLASQED